MDDYLFGCCFSVEWVIVTHPRRKAARAFSIFKQLPTSWQSHLWIITIIIALFFYHSKSFSLKRNPARCASTDLDALIFICNMLATSFSNLSWRPVLAVMVGAFLYVICLPMATQVRHHRLIHQHNFFFVFIHILWSPLPPKHRAESYT